MKYTLMHKEIPVITLEYNENALAFTDVLDIYNPACFPLGTMDPDKQLFTDKSFNIRLFNKWWSKRCIPDTRANIEEKMRFLKMVSTKEFLIKSMGLTLTDQYWMKPEKYDKTWAETNFFDNDFNENIGKQLFETTPSDDSCSGDALSPSPDAGTDGADPKKWIIDEVSKERILIKGDTREYFSVQYEPTNELLAAEIYKRLGLPYAEYEIVNHNQSYLSSSPCFLTKNTEMFSADKILCSFPVRSEKKNPFEHLIECCNRLRIPDAERDLTKLFTADYILAQEDRHYRNFSFLRDSNTLRWKGLAPVYDSGKCMRFGLTDEDFRNPDLMESRNIKARPFADNQKEQFDIISAAKYLKDLPFERLDNMEVFYDKKMQYNKRITPERRNLLCDLLINRISETERIITAGKIIM